MATKPQLEEQGRRIASEIKRISDDEVMSGAEKSAALDAVQPEWEKHMKDVESSSRASDMAAKLGSEHGGVVEAKTGKSLDRVRIASPWAARGADLALEALDEPDIEKFLYRGMGGRQKFDIGFELGTKAPGGDNSASNNLMGDFLYGQTGPAGIGQNPFGSTGAFAPGILPTFLPGIVEKLFYELTLSDLISEFPVSTPNISYLTESTANFQANAVQESGLAPWSSEAVSRTYAQVGKIANAMTISEEAIADAPTLWNFVQGRLLLGVQRQEEVQILAGPGMPGVGGLLSTFASNFTASSSSSLFGATSATGTSVAFPPAGTTGAGAVGATIASLAYGRKVSGVTGSGLYPSAVTVAENIHDAFVDIQLAVFKTPNAIVMHPRDWLQLRIAKDAQGQYFNSSFFGADYGTAGGSGVPGLGSGGKSLWGVPVVTTPLIPQHTVLTGWFDPSTVQIARRKGVTMQVTNLNGTDFVQGNVTARAESRLGLLCYRPTAFQLIQLATG